MPGPLLPPFTGDEDLDSFLVQVYEDISSSSSSGSGIDVDGGTGVITDPGTGTVLGYLYQYLSIKYADDNIGTNFSNSPTNRSYYGVHNNETGVESSNPADYTWFAVSGGFSTTHFLWFTPIGNRNIKFAVATTIPSYKWTLDPGTAVDLDNIVPGSTVSATEVDIPQLSDISQDMGVVTAGVFRSNKTSIGDTTSGFYLEGSTGKFHFGDATNSIYWDASTLTIKGTLNVGSSPAISGNTMTGSGALINTDGTFALGNAAGNIVRNSTGVFLNGFIAENNVSFSSALLQSGGAGVSSVSGDTKTTNDVSANPAYIETTFDTPRIFLYATGTIGTSYWAAGGGWLRFASSVQVYYNNGGTWTKMTANRNSTSLVYGMTNMTTTYGAYGIVSCAHVVDLAGLTGWNPGDTYRVALEYDIQCYDDTGAANANINIAALGMQIGAVELKI
jgi:hypothetical protein